MQEFCHFLRLMGARVEGVGASRLTIEGVERLGGADYTFTEDFHEVATFLALGAITGGEVAVRNAHPEQFPLIDRAFAKFGVEITHADGWSSSRPGRPLARARALHRLPAAQDRGGAVALPSGRSPADLRRLGGLRAGRDAVLEQGL